MINIKVKTQIKCETNFDNVQRKRKSFHNSINNVQGQAKRQIGYYLFLFVFKASCL